MTYLAPPPAPRRPHNTRPIHRLRWPWIPWFIGASSTLIGLGIFTLFADRRVSSLHDIGLDGRMLWVAMLVLIGLMLLLGRIAWPRGLYAWTWPWMVICASILLLFAFSAQRYINTYGWQYFRDGYPLYALSPWFLILGAIGMLLTSLIHIGALVLATRKRRAHVLQRRRDQVRRHRHP